MKTNRLEFFLMNNWVRGLIQEQIEIKNFLGVDNKIAGKTVLEIGCGNGFGAKLINKYFKPKTIYGIDLDKKMINLATKKNQHDNCYFTVGDATKLKFKDNFFDAVFDFGVIHHVPNWRQALKEIHRVLKKDGQVFIEDLSLETFESPLGKPLKKFLDHPYSSMYRAEEFYDYFEKLGFTILKKKILRPLSLFSYFVLVCTKN